MEGTSFHRAWIGIGTNLGDRKEHLATAQRHLGDKGGKIFAVSAIYETDPWGYESSNMFYNQCLAIETTYSPHSLLDLLQEIEQGMGRVFATGGYSDRIIDLDLLFYDDLVVHTEKLVLPHPKMQERVFVLRPLAEIAPEKIHPVIGVSVAELLERHPGNEEVKPV